MFRYMNNSIYKTRLMENDVCFNNEHPKRERHIDLPTKTFRPI